MRRLLVPLAFAVGLCVGWAILPTAKQVVRFDQEQVATSDAGFRAQAMSTRGRRASTAIWGRACGGHVVIRSRALPKIEGQQQAGNADYDYPAGAPLDTAHFGLCVITFDSSQHFSAVRLCAVIVHEWGHLTGHGHSRNPRSIMYPVLTRSNVPDACK